MAGEFKNISLENIDNIIIEKGIQSDVDKLLRLYDDLNDFLEGGINYPGWKKGLYPTCKEASNGVANGTLYVAKIAEKIVGSIILNHEPEPAYSKTRWKVNADYSRIFVVHTLVVDPSCLKNGIGMELIKFAIYHANNEGAQSIRLDVYENNLPAIRLYEKCGFEYVDIVDLGLSEYGLHHFRLYEKLL